MKWAWHVHHSILLEPLTEPIKNRIAYIKMDKPVNEIETRLRLLKSVRGHLPAELIKARKAYDEAWKAYDKAEKAYVKARKAYDEAWKAYDEAEKAYDEAEKAYDEAEKAYDEAEKATMPAILKLHAKECSDCPWDGQTIFPKVRR